ncbi:MAG: hypothetical protein N3C60_09015, partial [Calditerrivibrio sp.]|nr:hypothetical protein [Calditerrivibrio sp.]
LSSHIFCHLFSITDGLYFIKTASNFQTFLTEKIAVFLQNIKKKVGIGCHNLSILKIKKYFQNR